MKDNSITNEPYLIFTHLTYWINIDRNGTTIIQY